MMKEQYLLPPSELQRMVLANTDRIAHLGRTQDRLLDHTERLINLFEGLHPTSGIEAEVRHLKIVKNC